jgi:hypothetical protein
LIDEFRFDHSQLSLVELHEAGIRSTRSLEESFYDPFGNLVDITNSTDAFPLFISFGFSDSMVPILYVFEMVGDKVISKKARIFTREEIKKYYCGN